MTPTEPGYYWLKCYQNMDRTLVGIEVVEVRDFDNSGALTFGTFSDDLETYDLGDKSSVIAWGPKINPPEGLS